MSTQPAPVAQYASPGLKQPRARSLVPAVVLCALGVVMIVLGGCFLVGVMLVLFRDSPAPVSSLQYNYGDSFIVALYACAGVCFLVAAILLWVGIRRLMMWID